MPKRVAKKNPRRKAKKLAALDGNYAPKVRQEYLDFDYLDKLSPKELEFLNKFAEEEIHASFTNTNKDFNKSKKQKKAIYDRNNARNRCMHGIARAGGKLNMVDNIQNVVREDFDNPGTYEDELVESIDKKKAKDL